MTESLKGKIERAVADALSLQENIPLHQRVAKLPESSAVNLQDFRWTFHLQISSHVYGEMCFNLFYHGQLFHSIANDTARLGNVKWPLIGLFDCNQGIFPTLGSEDVADIGWEGLKWADQHVHRMMVGGEWHFGSDMARFMIDPDASCASTLAVCVDLEDKVCDVTRLIIINGELENGVDTAAMKADCDPFDVPKFLGHLASTKLPTNVLQEIQSLLAMPPTSTSTSSQTPPTTTHSVPNLGLPWTVPDEPDNEVCFG